MGQTFGLAGRTALVTGGARGLGDAIAAGLGRAGARVVINDRSQAACDAACGQLAAAGITVRSAVFDVADGD
ncbi:SDR family NAD(P)-dependent oxidoreductase, partial [Salmonella enterica]|nr:SDR family NAD(P)-dependent oxidoreductase [Salmonella enterica]